MQTNHTYYFQLNILNTFYNLSVALGNGEGKEVNIFWELNWSPTPWLLCPSCMHCFPDLISLENQPLSFPGQLFSDPEESLLSDWKQGRLKALVIEGSYQIAS